MNIWLIKIPLLHFFGQLIILKKWKKLNTLIVYSFKPSTANLQEEVLEKTDSIFSNYLLGAPKGLLCKN